MVGNLPAMWETGVQSLGWEGPLKKGPTPAFFPGESHGQRILVGYSPRGHKEWDTIEGLILLLFLCSMKTTQLFFTQKKIMKKSNILYVQ